MADKRMAGKIKDASTVEGGRDVRRGMAAADLQKAILDHLNFTQARTVEMATRNDWYMAIAYAVRDRMLDSR